MNKNILLIVQNNSFPFDKRVYREAKTLKEAGNNVFVISPKSNHDSGKNDLIEGINVIRYKDFTADGGVGGYLIEYSNAMFRIFLITLKLILTKKINVIHVANPPDLFWPIAIFCRIFGIKFIYDQHDLAPEMFNSKFNNSLIYKILTFNEKLSVKLSHRIIVVNSTFKERLINKWNINPNKCSIVYNGPPVDFYPIHNESLIKMYNGKRVVLYIGLMTINDHIEVIINAANELINNRNINNLHFILIGDGDVKKQMEDLTIQFKIESNIKFTGIVDHAKIREYLYIADVCIAPDLPNGLNEYLTLVKVLEYMKSSKAFVAFKLKETMDFADGAGLYAENELDFADKIVYLLENQKKASEMGKLGSKIINDNYLWSHSEKKLLKLYKSIL